MSRENIMRLLILLKKLETISGPDLSINQEIAEIMGWKQQATGDKIVWLQPEADISSRIPNYTGNLQDAFSLISQLSPESRSGLGWEGGLGSAKIGNNPPATARTPAIAACIAAIRLKKDQDVINFRKDLPT